MAATANSKDTAAQPVAAAPTSTVAPAVVASATTQQAPVPAMQPIQPPHAALHPDVDLKTCSAQEYLRVTVFPSLNTALTLLDRIRPNDPVDWLAVQLYRQSSTVRAGMTAIAEKQYRQQMEDSAFKTDIAVPARI